MKKNKSKNKYKRKYLTRAEALEQNPFLKETKLKRLFGYHMILGAALYKESYHAMLLGMILTILFLSMMIIELYFGIPILGFSITAKVIILILGALLIISVIAQLYGYKIRDRIDTTNIFKLDYARSLRFTWIFSGFITLIKCSS